MEEGFWTSYIFMRYRQVNIECAQLVIVCELCPMKEALRHGERAEVGALGKHIW